MAKSPAPKRDRGSRRNYAKLDSAIARKYRKNISTSRIAAALGLPATTVERRINKMIASGRLVARSKVSTSTWASPDSPRVKAYFELVKKGKGPQEFANRFHLTVGAAYKIWSKIKKQHDHRERWSMRYIEKISGFDHNRVKSSALRLGITLVKQSGPGGTTLTVTPDEGRMIIGDLWLHRMSTQSDLMSA